MCHSISCHINVAGSVGRFLLNQLSCPRIKAACDRLSCIAGHQTRKDAADRLRDLLRRAADAPLLHLRLILWRITHFLQPLSPLFFRCSGGQRPGVLRTLRLLKPFDIAHGRDDIGHLTADFTG
ncbi:hypothetical protein B9D02_07950 [Pantoea vagans]|nr:hypothetical protein B9D02_07950 [Pantoea vagans]